MKSMMTVLLGLMMSLYACQGNTENSASEEIQDPTTKAREEIKALEAVLFEENSEELDTSLAEKTILAYKNYVRMFPRDEHAPEYLFKAGDLTRGLGDLWGATKLFNMVSTNYPDNPLAPQALFFQGLCFQDLGQTEYARYSFEDIINKYPQHELVSDATAMLQMLEVGEEEFYDTNINDQ